MRKEGEVEAGDLLRRVKERGKVIKEWCCVIRELITFSSAVSTEARSRGTWTNHSSAVGEFHSFGIQGVEMHAKSISTHAKNVQKHVHSRMCFKERLTLQLVRLTGLVPLFRNPTEQHQMKLKVNPCLLA